MANGLDALDAKRERRGATSRSEAIPPPRHKPRSEAVSVDVDAPAFFESVVVPETQPPSPPKHPASSRAAASEHLVKTTMHLGPDEDAFLEDVRFAGRRATPKVDASRSAVARLAIARLAEQMSANEIVAELQRRARKTSGTGRKRM